MSGATAWRGPSIDTIKTIVSADFGVSIIDIESERRDRPTCRARWAAMSLARTMTPLSLPVIGRLFGDRDHTTVLHAVRTFADRIEKDPAMAREIARLRRFLAPSEHQSRETR